MTLLWCRFSFLFSLLISKRFQKCRTHNIFRVGIAKMHKLTHMCNACWSRVDKNRIKCIFWEGTKKMKIIGLKKVMILHYIKRRIQWTWTNINHFEDEKLWFFPIAGRSQWSVTHSTIHQHHVVHPRVTNKIG